MKTKDFLVEEEKEGQNARLDAHPPTSDRGRPPLDRRAAHHFPALSSGRWKPLEEKWRVQLLPLLLLMMSLMLMSEPPQRKRKQKEHRAQPSSTAPAGQPEKSALVVHW